MPRPLMDPRPPISVAYRNEDRVWMQQLARDFAMNKVLPIANELDPEHGLMPTSLLKELGSLGFFGIMIPEKFDGLGLGVFEYALVTEELARAWMSVASIIARSSLVTFFGIELQDHLMSKAARGEWFGALAMSEP